MMAVFYLSAKIPFPSEMLTILVEIGRHLSRKSFSSLVGKLSSLQLFVFIEAITFDTCCSVIAVNFLSSGM